MQKLVTPPCVPLTEWDCWDVCCTVLVAYRAIRNCLPRKDSFSESCCRPIVFQTACVIAACESCCGRFYLSSVYLFCLAGLPYRIALYLYEIFRINTVSVIKFYGAHVAYWAAGSDAFPTVSHIIGQCF